MRTFAQCPIGMWRDARFKGLSLEAKVGLYYLWSGPHSSSAGVSVVFDGYAAIDLAWPIERWIKCREELEAANFIERDPASETVLILDYFTVNRPNGRNHLAAIENQIASIQCPRLKGMAEQALADCRSSAASKTSNGGTSPELRTLLNKQQWSV